MAMKLHILLVLLVASCAPATLPVASWPTVTLASTSGEVATYPRDLAASHFTVFVFFANGCPCFGAHEARLRELVDKFGPRGVRFVFVDPETGRTIDEDVREARQRNLPAPGVPRSRRQARWRARRRVRDVSVVVDARGTIQYRGGIDSDKSHLRDDRTNYLADALDDLTAGRVPRRAEGKTLGCTLQTW